MERNRADLLRARDPYANHLKRQQQASADAREEKMAADPSLACLAQASADDAFPDARMSVWPFPLIDIQVGPVTWGNDRCTVHTAMILDVVWTPVTYHADLLCSVERRLLKPDSTALPISSVVTTFVGGEQSDLVSSFLQQYFIDQGIHTDSFDMTDSFNRFLQDYLATYTTHLLQDDLHLKSYFLGDLPWSYVDNHRHSFAERMKQMLEWGALLQQGHIPPALFYTDPVMYMTNTLSPYSPYASITRQRAKLFADHANALREVQHPTVLDQYVGDGTISLVVNKLVWEPQIHHLFDQNPKALLLAQRQRSLYWLEREATFHVQEGIWTVDESWPKTYRALNMLRNSSDEEIVQALDDFSDTMASGDTLRVDFAFAYTAEDWNDTGDHLTDPALLSYYHHMQHIIALSKQYPQNPSLSLEQLVECFMRQISDAQGSSVKFFGEDPIDLWQEISIQEFLKTQEAYFVSLYDNVLDKAVMSAFLQRQGVRCGKKATRAEVDAFLQQSIDEMRREMEEYDIFRNFAVDLGDEKQRQTFLEKMHLEDIDETFGPAFDVCVQYDPKGERIVYPLIFHRATLCSLGKDSYGNEITMNLPITTLTPEEVCTASLQYSRRMPLAKIRRLLEQSKFESHGQELLWTGMGMWVLTKK